MSTHAAMLTGAGPSRPGRLRRAIGQALRMPPAEHRYARVQEIASLDPVRDCVRVYRLFAEDFRAAQAYVITAGLFITYAPPRISRILNQSGELRDRTQKRVVDTVLIDDAYHEHGFEPGPGRDALRRMNEMHRKYDIHPEDFTFIGCWEAVFMVWFAENYGWRPVSRQEKIAAAEFAKLRGKHMTGSHPYPDTFEEMEDFCARWRDEQLRFEPQNKVLADSLLTLLLNDVPLPLRPAFRAFLLSVGPDERIITACGHQLPAPWAQTLARMAMRLYGALDPLITGRNPSTDDLITKQYPNGYRIPELGTHLSRRAREASEASEAIAGSCPV